MPLKCILLMSFPPAAESCFAYKGNIQIVTPKGQYMRGKLTFPFPLQVDTHEATAEAVDAVDNVVDLLASSLTAESLNETSKPIIIESEAMGKTDNKAQVNW